MPLVRSGEGVEEWFEGRDLFQRVKKSTDVGCAEGAEGAEGALTRGARHSSLVEEWSRSGEKVEEWSRTAIATTGPAPVTALRKHSKRLPTGVIHLIGQYIWSDTARFFFRNGTDVDMSVPIC